MVDVARRVNATWLTAVLGDVNPKLDDEYQTALAIDLLGDAATWSSRTTWCW